MGYHTWYNKNKFHIFEQEKTLLIQEFMIQKKSLWFHLYET